MTDREKQEKVQKLEFDIDSYLVNLRSELMKHDLDDATLGIVAAFMRAAFGEALILALNNPQEARSLLRRNGYSADANRT